MTPVYVSGCFGMLHPAGGTHGVLICGSLGDEAMNNYRPLVFLGERFAAAGCPTLRLEYYGVGDSAGEDGEPGRFQEWLNGIAVGVRWLRENCGVGPVTLVGVRIGAAIAARAACCIECVEGLICLAPVARGRRFLREMTLAANATAEIWQVENRINDGDWFEAHGVRIDRATHDALERLDIAALPRPPAPRALVLDQSDSPSGPATADALRHLGVDVVAESIDGLQGMLRDPYENAVPHAAFERAVQWATEHCRQQQFGPALVPTEPAVLRTGFGEERPVRFGPNNALFGILSKPAHARSNAPSVLIANTGANPRYSNSRGAVAIARWLAAHGIASLRIDGAGIADAAPETGERGMPYSALADLDHAAAIDELTRQCPGPVMALGMCSGAFHALRAAYSDARVSGLILVNLQKFVWEEGESLSVVQRTTFRTTRFYMRNVVSPAVWQRLARGEINVTGITRALTGRVIRRMAAAADPMLGLLQRHESHVRTVRRHMRQLDQRNVPILFVLSGNDPGLDEIAEYFGAQGRQLRRQPNIMFRLLHGADHTLSAHRSRETLMRMIAAFLRERVGVPIEGETQEPASPPPSKPMRLDALLRAPRRRPAIDTTRAAA
ncbi:MAG TPA: alpha/beta hydrolase [Acetobacteraceae bacterium]|jgi:pimeloyl-ACP methyl ester carboxylesterase